MLRKINPDAEKFPRAAQAEEALIGVLILHPDLIPKAVSVFPPEKMVTAFNKRMYQYLADRKSAGLLIELPFFSADFDDAEMAYIARTVETANKSAFTWEDTQKYIEIILEESALRGLSDPKSLNNDDIADILAVMRERKNKNTQ